MVSFLSRHILAGALLLAPHAHAQETLAAKVQSAAARGATFLRIHLLASDEELPAIQQAKEEIEYALDAPRDAVTPVAIGHQVFLSQILTFLKNRGSLLMHPLELLDLSRSFRNLQRLTYLSRDFESPWLRRMLINSAAMFGITHGSEIAFGTIVGTQHLIQGAAAWASGMDYSYHFGAALGWYGLALPGLYDFGCMLGAVILVVRPTRNAFDGLVRGVFFTTTKLTEWFGMQWVFRQLFEKQSAMSRLAQAIRNNPGSDFYDIEIPTSELLHFTLKDKAGSPVVDLQFAPNAHGDLALTDATFHLRRIRLRRGSWDFLPRFQERAAVDHALAPFGANASKAIRQILKLIQKHQTRFIEEEKTFVESVETSYTTLFVKFRTNSVVLKKKWIRKSCSSKLLVPIVGKTP